jgi:hypothetical protein
VSRTRAAPTPKKVCSFFAETSGWLSYFEDKPLDRVVRVVLRPVRCEHFQCASDARHFRVVTAHCAIRICRTEPKSRFSGHVAFLGSGNVFGCDCAQNLLCAIESVERTSQAYEHPVAKSEFSRDDLDVRGRVRQEDVEELQ